MRPNFPHVRVPGVALVIALCLGPVSAIAQEETPETLPAERINYAAGHVWMGSGLGASIVAIDGDARGTLIALSTEGAVYRRPAGGAWREVLGPTGVRLGDGDGLDEEAILLDAEGFIDEFEDMTIEWSRLGEEEADEVEDDTDEAPADLDEVEDMPDDLTELYQLDEQGDGTDAGPRPGGVVWMSTLVADLALVSRADGLWRSTDGGESWTPTDALGEVHAFSDAPRGLIIAGTPYGRRFSKDGGGRGTVISIRSVGLRRSTLRSMARRSTRERQRDSSSARMVSAGRSFSPGTTPMCRYGTLLWTVTGTAGSG